MRRNGSRPARRWLATSTGDVLLSWLRHGAGVVIGEEARPQLPNPVHAGGNPEARFGLEPLFELMLVEGVVAEGAEAGSEIAERPDQAELRGDEDYEEIEASAARKVEPSLGLALHLRERGGAG